MDDSNPSFTIAYECGSVYDDEFESEQDNDLANIFAKAASQASSEMEAEAMVAAAAGKVLPAQSKSVRKVAPNLVNGARILAKLIKFGATLRTLLD